MSMESIPKTILVGRVLMTLATLIYGVLPPFVDLTETHVFHPEWTPHSRLHMVWLLGTNSAVAVLALYFLWLHKANSPFGVRLSGILGLCVFGGFWLSASTISLYGGALSDKGGVPPILGMDANILIFFPLKFLDKLFVLVWILPSRLPSGHIAFCLLLQLASFRCPFVQESLFLRF